MKAKALLISGLLIFGLSSCCKEDDITPAPDTNSLVDQRINLTDNKKNPFSDKEFYIVFFSQNKSDKPKMKRIKLKFKASGLIEVKGDNLKENASWAFSNRSNKLMIRSNGKNFIMNQLSSDVWEVTSKMPGLVHLKAIHFEMVKEMDIKDVNMIKDDSISVPL